jgi:bifunctional ADP-heptose synthase (sugar kinase/adenylyltransferase)
MLAALSYIDWVAVNDAPTAENVIKAVRPDVYVKGEDYVQASDDVTGKIVHEREAVEVRGGRMHFTCDITFSSSGLLNRHFNVFEPELKAYLEEMRERDILGDLIRLVDAIKDMRVLVVGDAIIDEYHYVSPLGKSPKENIVPTLYRHKEEFAGGVIAAANSVADFCREVHVLTCIGEHDDGEQFLRSSLKSNVELTALKRHAAPTTRKRRYVDADYLRKMFEVYFMDDIPLTGPLEERFVSAITTHAPDYDVVIVTDFGHGLITAPAREALQTKSKFLTVNAQSNSANHGFNLITKYKRADYICIDAPEARLAAAEQHKDIEQIASETLPGMIDCSRLIVTHGRHGCITFDRENGLKHIPAFTRRAIDTMGAGDAFLSVTAPIVKVAKDLEHVGFIGNAVGAIKVGIVGHRSSVGRIALLKYLTTLLK